MYHLIKSTLILFLGVLFFFSCQNSKQLTATLDPTKTLESILVLGNVKTLEKTFGKQNLVYFDSIIYHPVHNLSGYFFNKGKNDQLIITLDTDGQRLKSVIANTPQSPWHSQGISVGTDLITIENTNKKPFIVAGFGWEYGGTILSWEGGSLKDTKLDIIFESPAQDKIKDIAGATDYFSSHTALQNLNPKVKYIAVYTN